MEVESKEAGFLSGGVTSLLGISACSAVRGDLRDGRDAFSDGCTFVGVGKLESVSFTVGAFGISLAGRLAWFSLGVGSTPLWLASGNRSHNDGGGAVRLTEVVLLFTFFTTVVM